VTRPDAGRRAFTNAEGRPRPGPGYPPPRRSRVFHPVARSVRRGSVAARRQLVMAVGGPARTRVVLLMACVLALASADTATVGASAVELTRALHINNTDIGLLVSVTSLVAAVFSLPFGVLADRARRTWILGLALLTWGVAMFWSATSSSFGELLLTRVWLGAVTAAAGPIVASLIGDWFPAAERGRIYGYILTGELLGAGVGFAFTGDIAALSWRLSFVILGIPALLLAWLVIRLPEPARGGQGVLVPEAGVPRGATLQPAEPLQPVDDPAQDETVPLRASKPHPAHGRGAAAGPDAPDAPDAQRLAKERGIRPDYELADRATGKMGFIAAVKYVLAVRTNVALIISSACGYYFLTGVQTFGAEFTGGEYHIDQVFANLLLLVVGVGAVGGVLASGPISDALLRRGYINARIMVPAVGATLTVFLFIPALVTHSALTALPYIVFAAAALSAQNPPIDAARLDIMPPWLWGRAEGLRTFLRTAAQALAPVLFGAVSDFIFGGGIAGLRWTFVVMLLPLAASAVFLYGARRLYPVDVATTAEAASRVPPTHSPQ
jgi:MFS family permease